MRGELGQLICRQHARIAALVDIDKRNRLGAAAVINLLARGATIVRAVLVQEQVVVFVRVVYDEDASGWGRGGGGSRGDGGG